MRNKHLVTYGILVAGLIRDARVARKRKAQINELTDDNIELSHALIQSQARVRYLASLIDLHGTPVDEFDLILLNDPV